MKRLTLSLAILASLALPATAAAQTAPPAACQFILGFKTLHDMNTADVGSCIDNQAFASNGDAQQHTSKGLMAWRKSDNWTAFTNGYMTWINGPNGLVSRLNTDRFPWENDKPAAPAAQPAPASTPALAPGELPSISGAWKLENNNTMYSVNQDYDGIAISPQVLRACTPNGQVTVNPSQTVQAANVMNRVFTGVLSGFTITGVWSSCQTTTSTWVGLPVTLTVSADGRHLTGHISEDLTFDRLTS